MSWQPTLLVPVREAALTRISAAGVADAPYFEILTSVDLLLATLALDSVTTGSVNPTTGVLTLNPGVAETNAPNGGTAAKANLYDRDGVLLAGPLTVVESPTAVANSVALSTVNIPLGGTVSLLSVTIG